MMVRILAFLVVLFLAFPVFAQTAREKLMYDPTLVEASPNLTEAELDRIVDDLLYNMRVSAKAKEITAAMERMEKMLKEDARLKADLMKE